MWLPLLLASMFTFCHSVFDRRPGFFQHFLNVCSLSYLFFNVFFIPFVRLVPRLFYDCDQGQVDPVVAVARDQSSVYLQLLMHEAQPPSQFTISTITRYTHELKCF